MSPSKAQIEQFFESPVWGAIAEKVEGELRGADVMLEQPDPFLHGKAVGRREMLRLFMGWKEILLTECSKNGPYHK